MSPFAHSGDEIKKLRKLIDVLKGDKSFLTKLEKTLSAVKAITNFYKSGKRVRLAVDEYLKASNSMTEESGRFFKRGSSTMMKIFGITSKEHQILQGSAQIKTRKTL